MGEITSYIAGEMLTRSIDWARAGIDAVAKRHGIQKLIDETAMRASMISSKIDLGAKLRNTSLVEEFIGHHQLMDISKMETISIFLGEEADAEAAALLDDFYEGLTRITAAGKDSVSSRHAEENTEEILRQVKDMRDGAVKEQMPLLEALAMDIKEGVIGVERIDELSNSGYGSPASSFFKAYYSLCADARFDCQSIEWVRESDTLVEALCSVAFSARRFDDLRSLITLFSFDASSLLNAMVEALASQGIASEKVVVEVPKGKNLDELIGLINFEHFCELNACHAAEQVATSGSLSWNPLAREKYAAVRLINAAVFRFAQIGDLAIEFAGRFRPWFPAGAIQWYRSALSVALALLDVERARHVVERIPDGMREFAEDEGKEIELRDCDDATTARGFVIWAEARRNPGFLIKAASRAIELDENSRGDVIAVFERNGDWSIPTPEALHFYSEVINPGISYESYIERGKAFGDAASFHLGAYSKFKDAIPDEATWHIERSLEIMRAPNGVPELLYSFVWVPYLVENGREDEVLEIVHETLPQAPADFLTPFLNAVLDSSASLLDRVIDSFAGADFADPTSAEMVAKYLEGSGDIEIAGRIAARAFAKRPSETLAETTARWMLESSLEVGQDIIRYAEELDTCRMNLLMANVEHAYNSPQRRNSLLLRAGLQNDRESWRALLLYAVWNAGGDDRIRRPTKIEADCYAKLKLENGELETVLFLSDHHAVKEEGEASLAGTAYSTSSALFVQLHGRLLGEVVGYRGMQAEVVEIGDVDAPIMAAGFAEIPKVPGGMVLTGEVDETIEKLTEIMAARKNDRRMDYYMDGFETPGGKLLLGIEAGRLIAPTRQFEFTVQAVLDPRMPYRKMPISTNFQFGGGERFLLTRSALIVLSLLGLPQEIVEAIESSCVATASTARKLTREATEYSNEIHEMSARLCFDGERPVCFEFDEKAKREASDRSLAVLEFAGRLYAVEPTLECSDTRLLRAFSDTNAIDVQTALGGGYALVTEDLVEAQIVDEFGLQKRCSVSAMLVYLGFAHYVFNEYAQRMLDWNAEPPFELDILELYRRLSEAQGVDVSGGSADDG